MMFVILLVFSYDGNEIGDFQSDAARAGIQGSIWGATWSTGNSLINARSGAFKTVIYATQVSSIPLGNTLSSNHYVAYAPDVPMGNEFKSVSLSCLPTMTY